MTSYKEIQKGMKALADKECTCIYSIATIAQWGKYEPVAKYSKCGRVTVGLISVVGTSKPDCKYFEGRSLSNLS